MSDVVKNIVTFGASNRIDNKINEYKSIYSTYENAYLGMEGKIEQTNQSLNKLVDVKVKAIETLKQIQKITNFIKSKDREFIYENLDRDYDKMDFDDLEKTISVGEAAINTTKGVSSGVSTALGAWALVSSLGTASTGTAIATLNGVVATNATLAWFGGGALTVGGGGMAAGSIVLGGLVAIPALALTGVFSHVSANKKIRDIEEKILVVIKSIDDIENNIFEFDCLDIRSKELVVSIEKAIEVFDIEYKKVYCKLYPYGKHSNYIRLFRKHILRKNYFSKIDYKKICYIGGLATDFATLIDTKII